LAGEGDWIWLWVRLPSTGENAIHDYTWNEELEQENGKFMTIGEILLGSPKYCVGKGGK
jgi:hypothetical protein